MPKCPHCGESYRFGQTNCYACGAEVHGRRKGRKSGANPRVLLIAGAVLLLVIAGAVLLVPRNQDEVKKQREQTEVERVRDSVRQSNLQVRSVQRLSRSEERLQAEIAELESRFVQLKDRVGDDKPSLEQARLVSEINLGISRLKSRLTTMSGKPDSAQVTIADSMRADARELRNLLSKFSRIR